MEVIWDFRICPENGIMEYWNNGILVFKWKFFHFNFIVAPACGGTINPTFHHPFRARFQPVGLTGRLPARRALAEHTARREGRLYEPEANIPIVSEAK
jgi:hypothetical protein